MGLGGWADPSAVWQPNTVWNRMTWGENTDPVRWK